MILYVDSAAAFFEALKELPKEDPYVCRMASLCRSYPPAMPFVDYWRITDDSGCCGAVARNGADFIVYLTERGDPSEVSAFLSMSGAGRVLCNGSITIDGYARVTEGVVMRATREILTEREADAAVPPLRDVYALIASCAGEGFMPPPFEDFHVDVSHKLRHGILRLRGVSCDGHLAAVAMTVAESDCCAVLGAVACHPDFRRRGCGTSAVAAVVNSLLREGKTVLLHRAQNENIVFYEKLGFINCGIWREYSN